MKKSKISILLLLIVMILAISSVSAEEIDDSSNLASVDDASDEIQSTSDTENLADLGDGGNFTSLQTLINTDQVSSISLTKDFTRVAGESDIEINKDFTIDGKGTYKLDANNLGGIFKVNEGKTLTLTGLTLINGNAQKGGAVYVNYGATLNVINCKFIENTAVYRGGAIYSEGTVGVENSVFDSNNITFRSGPASADNGGAAIFNFRGYLNIADSNFTNNLKNITIRDGAIGDFIDAVVVTSGPTTITGSYFANNTGSYGGAITSMGTLNSGSYTLTVKNSKFKGNNATFGGAIFVEASDIDVEGCTFENNKCNGVGSQGSSSTQGGAISIHPANSEITIKDSTFIANSAKIGGAISLSQIDTDSVIDNCSFIENTALQDAGAIYGYTNGSSLTITNSEFTKNTAARYGGAVLGYTTNNELIVDNCDFTENTAVGYGGGIFSQKSASVTDSIFVDNNAQSYSNAIMMNAVGCELTLSNNTIIGSDKTTQIRAVNGVKITTPLKVKILNNESVAINMAPFKITATVTDDNDNNIIDLSFRFVVGGNEVAGISIDPVTGVYSTTFTPTETGTFAVSTNLEDASEVQTGTLNIFRTLTDLANSIALAEEGGDIVLDDDYSFISEFDYDLVNGIVINKAVNIDGKGHTICGNDAARIFDVASSLVLRNLTICDAKAERGGAINVRSSSSLEVFDCVFKNNEANQPMAGSGGAIFANSNSIIAIMDSEFINNSATNQGGAVSLSSSSDVDISNSKFIDNKVTRLNMGMGGALYVGTNDIIISETDFINNTATNRGGAIYMAVANGNLEVLYSTFVGNEATLEGGAIYQGLTTSSRIMGSTFEDNIQNNAPNAIYLNSGDLDLIENNINTEFAEIYVNDRGTAAKIISTIKVEVLNNESVHAELHDDIKLFALITDDMGNLIKDYKFNILVDDEALDTEYNMDTGLYEADYTVERPGPKVVSVEYITTDNLEISTGIIDSPKANVTEFEIVPGGQINRIPYGENVTVYVTLFDDDVGLNETFKVIVNNIEYTVTVSDGMGSFNVSGLEPGQYSAFGIFDTDLSYNTAYASGVFTVLYPDAKLNVSVEDITYGDVAIVNINLTDADGDALDGTVVVIVNGRETVLRIFGNESLKISDLAANEEGYIVNVTFIANENYAEVVNDSETIKVFKATPGIEIIGPDEVAIGENAEFTVTVDAKVDNIVLSIWIDGVEYDVAPAEWEGTTAEFLIPSDKLTAIKDYEITIQYVESENYTASENKTHTLTVKKIDLSDNVTIEGSEITYGQNATITIDFGSISDVEGNITLTLAGVDGTFNTTVSGNIAIVEIPGLTGNKTYNIDSIVYSGSDKYDSFTIDDERISIEVNQASSEVFVEEIVDVSYPGEVHIGYYVINATKVTIKVIDANDTLVYNEIITDIPEDGEIIEFIDLTNLAAGKYWVSVINHENENYTVSSDTKAFNVLKALTSIEIEIPEDIKAGEQFKITVTVENATGTVTAFLDGEPISQMDYTLVNGTVNITIPFDRAVAGQHLFTVTYNGDENHTENIKEFELFNIAKADPVVLFDGVYNNDKLVGIDIFVGEMSGNIQLGYATGQILIEGYGLPRLVDLENGKYSLELYDVIPDDYCINVTYLGDDKYNKANNTYEFKVNKSNAEINVDVVTSEITYGDDAIIKVEMGDNFANGNVTFFIDDVEYSTFVLDGDYANVSVSLSDLGVGTHNITVVYNGNDFFNPNSTTLENAITVSKATPEIEIIGPDEVDMGEDAEFTVTVDAKVDNIVLSIWIDGVEYDVAPAEWEGTTAEFLIPSDKLTVAKDYEITVQYVESENYTASEIKKHILTVKKIDLSDKVIVEGSEITYGQNATITFDFGSISDVEGNITLTLVGVDGTFNTTVSGNIAIVEIPGLTGNKTYNVDSIVYSGSDKYDSFTIDDERISIEVKQASSLVVVQDIDDVPYPGEVHIGYTVTNATKVTIVLLDKNNEIVCNETITDIPENRILTGTFDKDGLDPGRYSLMVYNEETENYASEGGGTSFNVEKITTQMSTAIDDPIFVKEEDIVINVTLPSDAKGIVTVDIDGTQIEIGGAPVDGNLTVNIPPEYLTAGLHIYTVKFAGDDKYDSITMSKAFNVEKYSPVISSVINDTIFVGEEDIVINVTMNPDAIGWVTVTIDGVYIMTNHTVDGNLTVKVPSEYLTAGAHTYSIIYSGDDKYDGITVSKVFNVEKYSPVISSVINDTIFVGEDDIVINVTMNPDAIGLVTVTIDGVYIISNHTVDGNLTVKVPSEYLTAGAHTYSIIYSGDDKYDGITVSKVFNVEKYSPVISSVINDTIFVGDEGIVINVTMNPDATGLVTVTIDGDKIPTDGKLIDGNLTVNVPSELLTAGLHTYTITYAADNKYDAKMVSYAFNVLKISPSFTTDATEDAKVGENVTITISALPEDATGNITVLVDGELRYDGDIIRSINITDLQAGHHSYDVIYSGDDKYELSRDSNTFDVSKNDNATNVSIDVTVPEGTVSPEFSVTLPADATGYLLVDIGGERYYAPVENGVAKIVVPNLAPGSYTANVTYTGDDKYESVSNSTTVSIPSNVPENAITIPEGISSETDPTFSINLPADAGGYLEVDVDGTKYVVPVKNGTANITVPKLPAGDHKITVTYTGDGKYAAASQSTTINVKEPVAKLTNNKAVNVVYSGKATYKVRLLLDGKAAAGKTVTINFNGKNYDVKTNSKGYATLILDTKVKPTTYKVTATFKGVKVTSDVNVKHLIKASNKNAKKSKNLKLIVKTNKVNGKYLKGKKLKLKFKGKTYKAKINNKGKATFTIKSSVMNKLKAGKKYKYTVSYGKDKVTKKINVKK